jgi:hypothetical protein
MNLRRMPEFDWHYSYRLALLFTVVVAPDQSSISNNAAGWSCNDGAAVCPRKEFGGFHCFASPVTNR